MHAGCWLVRVVLWGGHWGVSIGRTGERQGYIFISMKFMFAKSKCVVQEFTDKLVSFVKGWGHIQLSCWRWFGYVLKNQ